MPVSLPPQSRIAPVRRPVQQIDTDYSSKSRHGHKIILSISYFENGSAWFCAIGSIPPQLTEFFNSLPSESRQYKERMKAWYFDFKIYEQFINTLRSSDFFDLVQVEELPPFLIRVLSKYMQSKILRVPDVDLNLEEELLDVLLPFQLEGIKFVVSKGGRAFIGDEMGCGKTVQAIGVIQHYRNHWPVLLIVPPNLIQQWIEELRKFSGGLLRPNDIQCMRKKDDPVRGKICLVPYSMIEKLVSADKIHPDQFGIVIADESHNIKSKEAQRTSACLPFLKKAKVALCLSGTPATNRPVELFTQLNALLPTVFSDYDAFTRRYCDAKPDKFRAGRPPLYCNERLVNS